MYKNRLLICSESIIMDAQTGNISVINILEDMIPAGLPLFLPKLSILHYLDREPADAEKTDLHIAISLEEQTIFEINHRVNFQGKLLARSIITLSGIPIQNPGKIKILVAPTRIEPVQYVINVQQPKNVKPKVVVQESN